MKKFLHSLLVLFVGITSVAFAGQSGPHTWDGSNKTLTLKLDTAITFSYTAAENGMLYIYSDNQGSGDNVPLTLEGGRYHDGGYDSDAPLQDVAPYENGLGFYSWIKVYKDDEVRFTISTPKESEGTQTRFTLKSAFFNESVGGNSWEKPIELTQNKETVIPVYPNYSSDILGDLEVDNVTFCKFTAPSDGVASIYTSEYLVYVLEEEYIGSLENPFRSVSQDASTNDHEFIVRKGVNYFVVVPNAHPTAVTFKMTYDRLGLSEKFPVVLEEFPADLSLVKGDNYYKIDHELIGDNTLMEVAAAAGWNGTITYMEGTNWGATESGEITADAVAGNAVTFVKNVDTRFLNGNAVVLNFNIQEQKGNATLTLRAPEAGESFNTAIAATLGENTVNGPARDYWFAYTVAADSELSFTSSATLKHVNYIAGVELMVQTNVYRVNEGNTIYVCVTAAAEGDHTLTISSREIMAGDYCDKPIEFELGNDITIEGRGIDNFHSFVAEGNGFAVFTSPGWSMHFREECDGRRLDAERIVTETPIEDSENPESENFNIQFTYKLPVLEGNTYIVELEAVSENITITTGFEAAVAGDVCATAIEIENLNDTIKFDNEFEVTRWYKVTAEKNGYYTVYAKLGNAANMKTKVGDCDATETNAPSDNSKGSDAYMAGYKAAKVYVEEGETLYIYTKTGSENEDAEKFGYNFYLVVTFAEPRPGENVNLAIEAEAGTEYSILNNDAEGYEQWYTYTIPAGEELTITLKATMKFITNALNFYREDKVTSMSAYKKDFTQTNLTNEAGETIGKNYAFAATDADRTIYIKVSTINAMYNPVVWKIEGDDNTGGDEASVVVEKADAEAPVIYDLMGRRVENPTKGIYIINGVKRVIK